jgi:WD40 repeat protein
MFEKIEQAGSSIRGVTFSDDGEVVALTTRSADAEANRLSLFNLRTQTLIAPLQPEASSSFRAFSQDGKYFASGGGGLTQVWSFPPLKEVARIEHNGRVRSITFSPDDKYIATGSSDRSVRLTLLQTQDLIKIACERAKGLTEAEWALYFDGEPYRQICPDTR